MYMISMLTFVYGIYCLIQRKGRNKNKKTLWKGQFYILVNNMIMKNLDL